MDANPTPASRAAAEFLKLLRDEELPEKFTHGPLFVEMIWGVKAKGAPGAIVVFSKGGTMTWVVNGANGRTDSWTGKIPPPLLERIREFATAKGDAKEGREERVVSQFRFPDR